MGSTSVYSFVEVSRFRPTLNLLTSLQEASLIFYSAKTTAAMRVNPAFFALTAYSFKTAVTDQKDAYTILNVFNESLANSSTNVAASKTKRSIHSTADERHGRAYFLWELSCG